jgi:hypothetical protein
MIGIKEFFQKKKRKEPTVIDSVIGYFGLILVPFFYLKLAFISGTEFGNFTAVFGQYTPVYILISICSLLLIVTSKTRYKIGFYFEFAILLFIFIYNFYSIFFVSKPFDITELLIGYFGISGLLYISYREIESSYKMKRKHIPKAMKDKFDNHIYVNGSKKRIIQLDINGAEISYDDPNYYPDEEVKIGLHVDRVQYVIDGVVLNVEDDKLIVKFVNLEEEAQIVISDLSRIVHQV